MSQFVKVRHADGREADITAAEVAFYGSMGFELVDGSVSASAPAPASGTTGDPLLDEIKGLRSDLTGIFGSAEPIEGELASLQYEPDPRLDLVLDELRGLRGDLVAIFGPSKQGTETADGETVELKEPAKPEEPKNDPPTVDPNPMSPDAEAQKKRK